MSLPTIRKVAEQNNIRIEIKLEQGWDVEKFGKSDAEHYVKICKIGSHYYKYIENTGVTSFSLTIMMSCVIEMMGTFTIKSIRKQKIGLWIVLN